MKEVIFTIGTMTGFNTTPVHGLAELVRGFSSSVTLEKEGKEPIDASALMRMISYGVKRGETIRFVINGEDEETAARSIEEYMADHFTDPELPEGEIPGGGDSEDTDDNETISDESDHY
ncbi:MAG: HPr family phosphocarrier protein [Ruminococcus sp.]|nr:HPr family phosphocarrier protein [Ruminococcus sp.]